MSSNPRSPSRSSTSSASSTSSNINTKNLAIRGKPLNGKPPNGPAPNGTAANGIATKSAAACAPKDRFHPTIKDTSISTIELLPCAKVFFSCYANAANKQRITLTCNNEEIGVFEGNGENAPMELTKPKLESGGRNLVLAVPISFELRECQVKFEYFGGNGELKTSKTLEPVSFGDNIIRTISINSTEDLKGDDFCDSQLKCDMMFPVQNNPTRIRIPKNHAVSISCMANAYFEQRVICQIDSEKKPFTFSGNGENAAMVSDRDGESLPYITLRPEIFDRFLTGIFTFVTNEGKTELARVGKPLPVAGPPDFSAVTVSTEDTAAAPGAKDKNDSVLRVVAIHHPDYIDFEKL